MGQLSLRYGWSEEALPPKFQENQEQRMHEIYRYVFFTDKVEGLIGANVDTLADRERRQPDGNLVRFGEGRAALVPGHPGNDQAAGRGERRALRVDRVPLSTPRITTASHTSAGRELHRAGRSADRAGRRASL